MTPDVFNSPEKYLGQHVTVCGFVHDRFEDQNIWPSRATVDGETGLGLEIDVSGSEKSAIDGKTICLEGQLIRRGCGTDLVCTASNYEFALRISR